MCTLGRWCLQPQHGGVEEAHPEKLIFLSGVNALSMVGCRVAVKNHCLVGFQPGWYRRQQSPYNRALQVG